MWPLLWEESEALGQTEEAPRHHMPCQPIAKLPGDPESCRGKVQPLGKSTAAKGRFWLRHLFQYQREDQFILTPSEFQQTDLWEFLTWDLRGPMGEM